MSRNKTLDELRDTAAALGPWFHNIDLGGVMTAPDHYLGDYPAVKWRRFANGDGSPTRSPPTSAARRSSTLAATLGSIRSK
jgi:hypothetical protein